MWAAGGGAVESLLGAALLQMAVILAAARLGAVAARRVGQPEVVGEFLAGLVLGPSVLGRWLPDIHRAIFWPTLPGSNTAESAVAVGQVLGVMAQVGVLLLLFQVGLETDRQHLLQRWRQVAAIAGAGLIVPLMAGIPLGYWLVQAERGTAISMGEPAVWFVAIAISITALPVLARILMDLQVTQTRLATQLLAAAAVTDLLVWVLLAGATAAARSQWEWIRLGETLAGVAVLLAVLFGPVRWWGGRYFNNCYRRDGRLSSTGWSVLLIVLLSASLAALKVGLHALFGAFATGVALAGLPELQRETAQRLQRLVQSFFLPLFFAYAGLRTDTALLLEQWSLGICLAVLAIAFVVKWLPCTLAAWCTGSPARDAAIAGALMNTRGLMGLVVASIGYEVGALSPALYALLVLLAEIMTLLTTPLVLLWARGSEWEVSLVAAGRLSPQPRPRWLAQLSRFVKN